MRHRHEGLRLNVTADRPDANRGRAVRRQFRGDGGDDVDAGRLRTRTDGEEQRDGERGKSHASYSFNS